MVEENTAGVDHQREDQQRQQNEPEPAADGFRVGFKVGMRWRCSLRKVWPLLDPEKKIQPQMNAKNANLKKYLSLRLHSPGRRQYVPSQVVDYSRLFAFFCGLTALSRLKSPMRSDSASPPWPLRA
jgi:hypothetical protein